MDYKKAYVLLFNAMTDAVNEIGESKIITKEVSNGLELLKKAQLSTEEMYISNPL